ncbi:hypothetical protein D3C74_395140 [compost metagenome]
MPAMITAAMRNPTTNRSTGSVNTKNEMSIPYCGSSVPKGTEFIASRTVLHCEDAAAPAKNPMMAGPATVTTLRSGSTASRYWSSVACSGVEGA